MNRALFISIKPEFVSKIFSGEKTIELRKLAPKINVDDTIILYSTSPVMAVIGICKVEKIIISTPLTIWEKNSDLLGIDKIRYNQYFQDKTKAVAIFLKDIEKLKNPIPLAVLKSKYANFHPPQTYRYFNTEQFENLFKQINI